jgi:hypothetical protein
MTWNTQTLAQNPNANAIRWGTLYNFRFDSDRAPATVNATVGFFKTGAPITVQVQAPGGPAAGVSVGGRVSNSGGTGLYRIRVSITDTGGNVRTTTTNPFGYYRFDNIPAGASYTVAALSKLYTFTSQTMPVNDNLTAVDFVALP